MDLWCEFRPYLTSAVARTKFVIADYVPFVVLSNKILAALQRSTLAKTLVPTISAGSLMALDVDATALYCIFGVARAETQLYIEDGTVIKDALEANARKQLMLAGLLDMAKVRGICQKHGLSLPERFVFLANGAVRLTAQKLKPLESAYERRRREGKYQQVPDKYELHGKTDRYVKELLTRLETKKEEILEDKKKITDEDTERTAYAKEVLVQKEKDVRMAIHVVKQELARRSKKPTKIEKGKGKAQGTSKDEATSSNAQAPKENPPVVIPPSVPTLKYHALEDSAEKIDISKLRAECDIHKRHLVFGGTDYGVCTLAVSVGLERPPPFAVRKTTAMYIHTHSLANKHARLRERRKRLRSDVAELEERLSRASCKKDASLAEIFSAHEVQLYRSICHHGSDD